MLKVRSVSPWSLQLDRSLFAARGSDAFSPLLGHIAKMTAIACGVSLISACGGAPDTDLNAQPQDQNPSYDPDSITLPMDPIDLSTAYAFVPTERPALGACGFASIDAVNQIPKRLSANTAFSTSLIEANECGWSNDYAGNVAVQRVPFAEIGRASCRERV